MSVLLIARGTGFAFLATGLLLAQKVDSPGPEPVIVQPKTGETPLPGDPGSTEDKRIFGVFPNYRTADGSSPYMPITTKQKFTIATKDTLNYPSYLLAGAFASLSQLNNDNPSFGQGLKGYGKRYAAAVADQDTGNYMTEAILPSLLHEDPRYFRKGHGSGKARVWYAVTRLVITKTDSGGSRFNTSEVLGNGIVASLGNWYYPDSRSAGDTMQRMGTQIGTDAISDVLKEFWPDVKHRWLNKR